MKKPGFLLSLLPVILMTVLLAAAVAIFGDEVTNGPSQTVIITTCIITCLIGVYKLKIPWDNFDEAIGDNMKKTGGAIFILLMIGALTSTWMLSGVVPTMIDYGLRLIHPRIFIFITFILCTMVSVLAGSSWTTVGTIGVAMLSAGQIIGLPSGWLAGAIISGAYLGDKISPLSDTTNLSASIAEVPLYTHVRYMMGTTVPAFIICCVVYLIVGFSIPVSSTPEVTAQLDAIESTFTISPLLLLIPCATFFMIYKKVPAFLTLFISAFIGAIVAFWAQPQIISQATGGLGGFGAFCFTTFKMMSNGLSIDTGNELMNNLTSTGGMLGMMNTVSLIICVIALSGALYASGMIQTITEKMLLLMKNTTSVVASTVFTCIFCNFILADQYMAILLPGRMFADTYKRKGLEPKLLSRTLQDSATVSSVLVPWNTCAVAQSGVLGIATMAYFPYAIFCFITPLIAIAIAASGLHIGHLPIEENQAELAANQA